MKRSHRRGDAPRLQIVEGGNRAVQYSAEEIDRSLPVVTISILVVIVAVFLAMFICGHGDINAVARQFGDKETDLIQSGQWWRLITPIFLHGSWTHLIVNGLSLVWFGGQIERIYGGRKFFLIYVVAGVAGNVLSYLMLPTPSLGASGALFGLIGAGLIFPLRFRNLMPVKEREAILKQLAIVAAVNLALSFSPGIDRYAHFGGFIGGGFVALFLIPDVLDERTRNRTREAVLTLAAGLTLGILILAAGKQWNVARTETIGNTVSYGPAGPNSWWNFKLSDRWKPVNLQEAGAIWVGPQGARITVVDSLANADLFEETEQWRAANEAVTTQTTIDGHPATISTVSANGIVLQLCQVFAYQRTIDIGLKCSNAVYDAAHKDYQALLQSIRFSRPPEAP